jgi:hypothetical protein
MFHHLLQSHHQAVKILKELVLHNGKIILQYTAQISTLQKVYTMEAEKVELYK